MTMTIPAIPGLQQPIAVTPRPVTTHNSQFGAVPPGIAGDRSVTHNGGYGVAERRAMQVTLGSRLMGGSSAR